MVCWKKSIARTRAMDPLFAVKRRAVYCPSTNTKSRSFDKLFKKMRVANFVKKSTCIARDDYIVL